MNREDQEKLYRAMMGEEAAARQKVDSCWGCGVKKGQPHSPACRYQNASRAGAKRRAKRH